MSWLAKSLANSLIADERRTDGDEGGASSSASYGDRRSPSPGSDDDSNRGVKEDLSELTQTLTRQLKGVASFLSPPPPPPPPPLPSTSSHLDRRSDLRAADQSDRDGAADVTQSPRFSGIRNDFAEIGGRFRSGLSRLSNDAGIGKIASNFARFGTQEEVEEEELEEEEEVVEVSAIGITDEVLTFAMNIAMHPETWLDFPLFDEFEDTNDSEMSDAQQEHALAIESLLPRFAALRIELCPTHMTKGCFWKIYFVLLHSRLNKQDAELLSTPQIVEARAMLLHKLQSRTKPDYEISCRDQPYQSVYATSASPSGEVPSPSGMFSETAQANSYRYLETDKHALHTSELDIFDKSENEGEPVTCHPNRDIVSNFSEISIQDYGDDDGDDWLEEEAAGLTASMSILYEHIEDVSFSDLEEEEEPTRPLRSLNSSNASVLPSKSSDG